MIIDRLFLFSVHEMFSKSIQPELNQQEQNDALQRHFNDLIDFASNDYFFLSQKLF
jgi:7-keto-8-aminopelargonate synthetase-like enzyme